MTYRWREANGDVGYDASDDANVDDCGYCGCPPLYQDPSWDVEMTPAENQCPQCGAANLHPLQPTTNKEKRKMVTEQRVNAIANVLIQAVEVHLNPSVESEQALIAAAHGLDQDGASVLTNLAKGLLQLSGSADEETGDATD